MNSTLSCIFILCRTNNVDHDSHEEIVSRLISSVIFVQAQCHRAEVVVIPLLPCDKNFTLREGNINIINSLLKSECPKHNLCRYNHELEWLNADGSLTLPGLGFFENLRTGGVGAIRPVVKKHPVSQKVFVHFT